MYYIIRVLGWWYRKNQTILLCVYYSYTHWQYDIMRLCGIAEEVIGISGGNMHIGLDKRVEIYIWRCNLAMVNASWTPSAARAKNKIHSFTADFWLSLITALVDQLFSS